MKNIVLIFTTVVLLSGCVIGQKTSFDGETSYGTKFNQDAKLSLAVVDQRPYVLNNDKDPSFTGLLRSLYGIPYSTFSKSGKPIADELSMLFSRSLTKEGVESKSLNNDAEPVTQEIIKKHAANGWHTIFFELNEWKHDIGGTGNGRFLYDIKVDVLNSDLKTLATELAVGSININKKFPLGLAYKDVVKEILNRDSILAAVNSNIQQTSTTNDTANTTHDNKLEDKNDEPSCSVNQRLSMQSSGLSETQITAACGPTK